MDTQELRDCTNERLADLEKNLRRQIFDARMKNHTNQLDDTASLRRLRRDLARIKTIMSEKLIGDAAVAEAKAAAAADAAELDTTDDDGAAEATEEKNDD